VAQRKTSRKSGSKPRTSSPSLKKADSSRKSKPSARPNSDSAAKSAGEQEITIDRRRASGRRSGDGLPGATSSATEPKLERRQKVNRRRQIDPTTCERDYTDGEVEFMNAIDEYKRKSGRMFPTCSEVLEVVRSLGYVKLSPAEFALYQSTTSEVKSSAPDKWFAPGGEFDAENRDELEAVLAD
jgi:hypothetical protein